MNPNELTDLLRRNLKTIEKNTAGISDDLANARAGQGSSLNWVVGHALATRTSLLELLKIQPEFDAQAMRDLYGTRTHPDAARAVPLAQLVQQLAATQAPLEAALLTADLSPSVESPFGPKTLGELINFFVWHEGYHAGQTVIFRHLALD